jgi:superfamily II DNA or RNA helicase
MELPDVRAEIKISVVIQLRPYQSDIIERTRDALRRVRSVLIHSPTGSGKTALAAFMLGSARQRGRRSWFIAHRDFLLEQTAATFDKVGIPYSFVAAGRWHDPSELVQICSIGTLQRRLGRLALPDVIVWDECHHIASASYTRVYEWATGARHVGLTATPARLDGKGLRKYFNEIVPGPSVSTLIRDGFLSPYRAFAPTAPSMAGVHTIAGDYNRGELADVMDTDQIVGDLVRHYRERANGMRAVYYCVSIRHSEQVASMFKF